MFLCFALCRCHVLLLRLALPHWTNAWSCGQWDHKKVEMLICVSWGRNEKLTNLTSQYSCYSVLLIAGSQHCFDLKPPNWSRSSCHCIVAWSNKSSSCWEVGELFFVFFILFLYTVNIVFFSAFRNIDLTRI